MNTQFTNPEKPTFVNVIAWKTLASGDVNLFWGLALVVVGILALVFYNDVIVRDYFARLNGAAPLAPVQPAPPTPIVDSTPPPAEPPFPGDETPKS
jgi:hypothetical protein